MNAIRHVARALRRIRLESTSILHATFPAALMATLLLLLLSPSPGRAQTYAVSNLGQTSASSSLTLDKVYAQSFTTGSNVEGYTLESITLDFATGTSTPSNLAVDVRAAKSNGDPVVAADKLADLTKPSNLNSSGTKTFNAPANTVLDASTTYFMFLRYTGSSNRPALQRIQVGSDGEDSGGLSGWSIGPTRHHHDDSWKAQGTPIQIGVSATVNTTPGPPARAVSNLAQYSTGSQGFPGSGTVLAQGFTTGSKSGGYTLREVQVAFSLGSVGQDVGSISDLVAELRGFDTVNSRPASTVLATFTNPDELAAGHLIFTAPANTTLNANTSYYVHLKWTGSYSRRPKLWTTTSDNEDSGEMSGWFIHNLRYQHASGSWSTNTDALKIAVISESSLSEPTNVTVSPGECQLTVSWSPPADKGFSDVRGYHVRVSGRVQWVPVGDSRSKVIWFLSGQQTYQVEVRAYNLQGFGQAASASGTTTGNCGHTSWSGFWPHQKPGQLGGQPDHPDDCGPGCGIRLTWTAPEGASDTVTGYEVKWSEDGSTNWQRVNPPHSGPTPRYTHTGLTPNKEYFYRVRATGDDGESNWSNTISVRTAPASEQQEGEWTEDLTAGRQPRNLAASATDAGIVLSWNAPDNAADEVTGYQILRRRPGQGEDTLLIWVEDTGSTATSYTDAAVTEGVRHVYRVKAIRGRELSGVSNYVSLTAVALATSEPSPDDSTPPDDDGSTTPLTASFENVPATHDGEGTPVTFRLSFSEPVTASYRTLRDIALQATKGQVTKSKRVNGSNQFWDVRVVPSSNEPVTVSLTGGIACGQSGAVCTADDRPLSNSPSVTVGSPPASKIVATQTSLLANRPNPFNSTTQITYHLAAPAPVRLIIYNTLGQVVATLVDAFQETGAYQVAWDGRDARGARVVSGVYLYRLQAGSFDAVGKMTILQ